MKSSAFASARKSCRGAAACSAQARLPGGAYSPLCGRKEDIRLPRTSDCPLRQTGRLDLIVREERKLAMIDNNLTKHR